MHKWELQKTGPVIAPTITPKGPPTINAILKQKYIVYKDPVEIIATPKP
jgi:hypothetical protein